MELNKVYQRFAGHPAKAGLAGGSVSAAAPRTKIAVLKQVFHNDTILLPIPDFPCCYIQDKTYS